MARLRRALAVAVALACVAASGAAGATSLYAQVRGDFTARGQIPVCRYSAAQLESVLRQAPTYDAEYLSSLTDALNLTIQAQADGACRPHHRVTAAGLGGGFSGVRPPAGITSPTTAGLPLPVLGLLALAGLMVLGALLGAVLRGLGAGAPPGPAARHALAEAEYRLGGFWTELLDHLRR